MEMAQYLSSTGEYTKHYRDPEEMSSASSIAGGPVKESSKVRKFMKKHSEINWVGS